MRYFSMLLFCVLLGLRSAFAQVVPMESKVVEVDTGISFQYWIAKYHAKSDIGDDFIAGNFLNPIYTHSRPRANFLPNDNVAFKVYSVEHIDQLESKIKILEEEKLNEMADQIRNELFQALNGLTTKLANEAIEADIRKFVQYEVARQLSETNNEVQRLSALSGLTNTKQFDIFINEQLVTRYTEEGAKEEFWKGNPVSSHEPEHGSLIYKTVVAHPVFDIQMLREEAHPVLQSAPVGAECTFLDADGKVRKAIKQPDGRWTRVVDDSYVW